LQTALPTGVTAATYFTGTISAGNQLDAVFDTYKIAITPTEGIVIKTNNTTAATVLTIPSSTVESNSSQPLPVITPNTIPVANAGTSQNAVVGTTVTLDGSNSSDANADTLSYSWVISSKPVGSSAVLSNMHIVNPTFTPDIAGTYSVSLTVNDGKVNSTAATVIVSASAIVPPVANAGPNQTIIIGSVVTLDGSGSTDSNNHTLTYSWTLTSKPSGSSATLSSSSSVKPILTPTAIGTYVFSLKVNNGLSDSIPATVSVSIIDNVGNISISVSY
jgi:PKD domain